MITVGLYGVPDVTHVADIPTYTHDHGVAVMQDGRVLSVAELERWTGRKHDNRLPMFIHQILANLVPPDQPVRFVSANSFVGNSFISTDGNLRIEPDGKVEIESIITPARVRWYPDGVTLRPADGWIICHELAHLATLLPFVGHFSAGALLAHVDGGASDSASSVWQATVEGLRLVSKSWDRLKAPVNNFNVNPLVRAILGLEDWEHLSMPGKLMGYAGWGKPRPELASWLAEHNWFLRGPTTSTELLEMINRQFSQHLERFDPRVSLFQDICATIQADFEEKIVEAILADLHFTGADVLYYAGGAALNIPTNVRLEGLVHQLHIPPPTSDAGLALGAAAWVEYQDYGRLPLHSPFLNRFGTPTYSPPLNAVSDVAKLLSRNKIVGICNGAGEVGPRALGHRSILARADCPDLRRRLSEKIKGREWYRPLAPVLAEEIAVDVLNRDASSSSLSPYMLGAWQVRDGWHDAFRGVLHKDGTVRAQVVRGSDPENTWLHALLLQIWEEYNLPGLINTSFNPRGQAILHWHEQALPLAKRMGLDAVVIHGSLHLI